MIRRALVVVALAAATAGCSKHGTFALLDIDAADPSLVAASIDLQMTFAGRSVSHTLQEAAGGPVQLPTSIAVSLASGTGTFDVVAIARDDGGNALAQGEGSGPISAGQTATIPIHIGLADGDGGGGAGDLGDGGGALGVTPAAVTVTVGRKQPFAASAPVTWSVMESSGGSVDAGGVYSAPTTPGTYHVVATSSADASLTASATVTVSGPDIEVLAGVIGGQGNIDGAGAAARFTTIKSAALMSQLNILFVLDDTSLRKVDLATNGVTTLLTKAQAGWTNPWSIVSDNGGTVYVSDYDTHVIYQVPYNSTPTVYAGTANMNGLTDGVGAAARLDHPAQLAIDAPHSYVYFADSYNDAIRRLDTQPTRSPGSVTTVAGGTFGYMEGTGSGAKFELPLGVAFDTGGNLFVADSYNYVVRQIVGATGATSLIAGSAGSGGFADGTGMAARFDGPGSVMNDHSGYLWVPDASCFRRVQISTGAVTTPIGVHGAMAPSTDGTGTAATFNFAGAGAVDDSGNLFVSDYSAVRKIETSTLKVTTIAGSTAQYGSADGARGQARFLGPQGLASDGKGNVYVADEYNQTIRRVSIATGETTTLAGMVSTTGGYTDGPALSAQFYYPTGVAVDGDKVFVADSGNNVIREIDTTAGTVSTFAGTATQNMGQEKDGTGPTAAFSGPNDIVSDGKGNLFVADNNGCTIRQLVIATQVVTTLAGTGGDCTNTDGTGAAARFMYPMNLGIDGLGNLYNADNRNQVIRRINIATGVVKTIAGASGTTGSADGAGGVARFNGPSGVTGDATGRVYVADTYNSTIRLLTPGAGDTYTVSTIAGTVGAAGLKLGSLPGILGEPLRLRLTGAGDLALVDQFEEAVMLVRIAP